jgi:hypothetical protein
MEVCHSPCKSKKMSSGNGGLRGDVEPRTAKDQKQLCRPGSRGCGAFVSGGFPIKIGSGGTCVFGSVSLSPVASTTGSNPHQTMSLPERPAHSKSPAVIIGSSMVRNISVPKAKTLCYPGARIQDKTRLLPTVLPQMPGADTVVIHVGSNNNRRASSAGPLGNIPLKRQSSKLKNVFFSQICNFHTFTSAIHQIKV